MIKLAIIISCIVISIPVIGQQNVGDPTAKYSKKEYQKDFQQLVELLVKNHPKVYEFISEQDFNQLIKVQANKITDSTSIGQFLWICEEVAASIKCGHTYVWWPSDFGMHPDSLLFPVNIWSHDFRLYITNARNNSSKVSVKSEILTINNVDVATLLKQMYLCTPADGNNQASRTQWVNKVFNFYCPMYFNYPEYYTVTIKTDEEIKTVQLDKYLWEEKSPKSNSSCSEILCFEVEPSTQTGILTIKSFNYYEENFAEFKAFIDSSFTQINTQGVKNLIIDLRGNGGGDSYCGSYLIEHFADKPYFYWPFDSSATWQPDLHDTIQPNANRFQGIPYILVNGGCFSTTGHVCSIIKENHFGILVGEETGGTFTCNDNSITGSLTHTGLSYNIPRNTFRTSATTFPSDRGILPDVEIHRTLNDIIEHNDPEIMYVLEQIGLE